jgi:hypothetical protein
MNWLVFKGRAMVLIVKTFAFDLISGQEHAAQSPHKSRSIYQELMAEH